MSKSLLLAIDELAQGQVQAFSTVNDMLAALEQASNAVLDVTTTSDYTMAELDFVRYGVFRFTGMTANSTITLPSTVNTLSITRVFAIVNLSTQYDLTISSGAGADVTVPYSSSRVILAIGTAVYTLAEGGRVTGVPHTTALFAAGAPTHAAEVLRYAFSEAVSWEDDFASSKGGVGTNPNVTPYFIVKKNGTVIGHVAVSTGGAFTFYSTGTTTSWAVGDVLSVQYCEHVGTIAFTAVADVGDTVTINDGATSETFTYVASGGSGTNVNVGATATDSATNLKTAIDASSLATTIYVYRSGATLTIVHRLASTAGSAITKSDADNDYTVTDFASDTAGSDYAITFYGTR